MCDVCALRIRSAGTLPRSFGRWVFPLVYRRRGVPARGVARRRDAGASRAHRVTTRRRPRRRESHAEPTNIHPRYTLPWTRKSTLTRNTRSEWTNDYNNIRASAALYCIYTSYKLHDWHCATKQNPKTVMSLARYAAGIHNNYIVRHLLYVILLILRSCNEPDALLFKGILLVLQRKLEVLRSTMIMESSIRKYIDTRSEHYSNNKYKYTSWIIPNSVRHVYRKILRGRRSYPSAVYTCMEIT